VPAYLAMRKDEFTSAPLRWLHAALRLANNPQDREQVRRLSLAFYGIEGLQIDPNAARANAEAFEGSALRAFGELAIARPEISPETKTYLASVLPRLTDHLDFRGFCSGTSSGLNVPRA
jgi:DNA helicase-2/ATP-dependent DNA helicase PcrA